MELGQPSETAPVVNAAEVAPVASSYEQSLKDIGEDTVKRVISEVLKPYAKEKLADLKLGSFQIGVLVLPFIDQAEAALLALADKIDGQVG